MKLNEMPYIDYGPNKVFDLELENFKTEADIFKLFDNILSGKPLMDKYGDLIQLKNRNEKVDFITALSHNDMFIGILEHRFHITFLELLDKVINRYV